MSSSCGAVCLLVLLGVVFAIGNPIQPNDEELKNIHESIVNELDLKKAGISQRPLFSPVINSINTPCQRKEDVQLMNVTLDVYLRIFSNILEPSNNPETPTLLAHVPNRSHVEQQLRKLQQKMEEMKQRLNHQSHHNRDEMIHRLQRIKVDDPEVQKRALIQFSEIYRVASVIGRRCGPAHASSAE
ncbi:interferon gamma 1-like [Notolabrus celidotus]|uniref:interferon gamma 1-like n=1 Tax=Notolabrus celidotus TaxID=1203425 RepID=UPI00148FB72A|nr:interferon gamma 1-like [Notolabrus celidotus]